MKRFLLTMLLTGLFAVCASAVPIQYNIAFSGGTPNPTAGSFTYDASTTTFSAFSVTWEGLNFDLTISANNPGGANGCTATPAQLFSVLAGGPGVCAGTNSIGWSGDTVTPTQWLFGFSDTGTGSGPPSVGIGAQLIGPAHDPVATGGSFLVTQATTGTPEPASIALTLAGAAGLLLRRRMSRRHSA